MVNLINLIIINIYKLFKWYIIFFKHLRCKTNRYIVRVLSSLVFICSLARRSMNLSRITKSFTNINEIFHILKNLVKNKNKIITKPAKIIKNWGSFLWWQIGAVWLQSGAARKLQSEPKKLHSDQVLQKGVKNYKVGQKLLGRA